MTGPTTTRPGGAGPSETAPTCSKCGTKMCACCVERYGHTECAFCRTFPRPRSAELLGASRDLLNKLGYQHNNTLAREEARRRLEVAVRAYDERETDA